MKKFVVAVAVVALVAFSAPVFASTNPFMDVPMNHWAYDAIGQLAAHGILSGYPDGTYKGKQPTTRYEMASALARALAVVDMTKASKQDVEMLKKLVVEFKDELEALGVRVDDLDERVKVLEDRLGGWHIHGQLRLDVRNFGDRDTPTSENSVAMTRARLFFERNFGEDESIFFRARLDNTNDSDKWQQFYVEMPFFFDTKLTVGRFGWDMGSAYYLGGDTAMPATGGYAAFDSVLTDRNLEALGLTKNFGLGSVQAYVAHPQASYFATPRASRRGGDGAPAGVDYGAWELFLMGKFQFTEQFGFDIGGQAFFGDNAEPAVGSRSVNNTSFNKLWTVFAGLRFNFNENIAFKGIYYHQKWNGDYWTGTGWRDVDADSANHWRVILDVSQEMLKFTSVWLEYGQMGQGFVSPTGLSGGPALFATGSTRSGMDSVMSRGDLKYWRAALGQEWNEKWATHLFYFGYNFDDNATAGDLKEWGLGVRYTLNPSVKFGLNYVHADWDNIDDDHIVRFRTEVAF